MRHAVKLKFNVTFIIDASGVLDVKAIDVGTGKEQAIRINLLGGADETEIAEMRERQKELLAN